LYLFLAVQINGVNMVNNTNETKYTHRDNIKKSSHTQTVKCTRMLTDHTKLKTYFRCFLCNPARKWIGTGPLWSTSASRHINKCAEPI